MAKKSRKELEAKIESLKAELKRRRQEIGDHPLTKKVIEMISAQLDVPVEDIELESSIRDDLKAEELDIAELVMALEDEFDVKIPDEDYDKIKTVKDYVDYIERLI